MSKAREISDRIKTVASTKEITQAMKVVASTKLAQVKKKLDASSMYTQHLHDIFQQTAHNQVAYLHELSVFRKTPVKNRLLILLAADRGLCGAFNQYIFRYFQAVYEKSLADNITTTVLPIGRLASSYVKKGDITNFINDYVRLNQMATESTIKPFFNFLKTQFQQDAYQQIDIVYQPNPNAEKESVVCQKLLPLQLPQLDTTVKEDSYPKTIYERNREGVLFYLLPKLLFNQLRQVFLQSYFSEQRTRMITMSKATDNADELLKELQLLYNRTRQQGITRQIIEIAAGAEALQH